MRIPKNTLGTALPVLVFSTLLGFHLNADPGKTSTETDAEKGNGSRVFFDAHVHFSSTKPGDFERVAKWMEELNIGRVINHPLKPSRPRNEAERAQMLENYAKYKGKIERFCVIFPEEVGTVDEAIEILTKEKQDGAVGFGEHYGGRLPFDDPKNLLLYEACEKVGLPVMFHMDRGTNTDEADLPRLENVLKKFPDLILIAHSDWWRRIGNGSCGRLLAKYPNLYADISCTVARSPIGRDKKMAREFFIEHADKLLFGTDSGWWSWKKDAPPMPEFALIGELKLPQDVEDKICRENFQKLFPSP